MAVTHPTAVRNGIANYVVDLIDAGAGSGTLIFRTSANAEVATLTFSATAFGAAGAVNPGEAIAAAITDDTDATGGVVTNFIVQDSDAVLVTSGSAGTSGDIVLTSATIGAGDTVGCDSLTYTAPA